MNDLPDNKYYYKKLYNVAGTRSQDVVSLCLILMAYEMGIKKYEENMKSMNDKKKTIRTFADEELYNSQIRTLVRDAVIKESDKVGFRDILKVVEGLSVKTEYVSPPPKKKLKS